MNISIPFTIQAYDHRLLPKDSPMNRVMTRHKVATTIQGPPETDSGNFISDHTTEKL